MALWYYKSTRHIGPQYIYIFIYIYIYAYLNHDIPQWSLAQEKVHPFRHLNVCKWFLLQGALQMALLNCTAAHHIGRRRPLPLKSIIPGQNGDTCLSACHSQLKRTGWQKKRQTTVKQPCVGFHFSTCQKISCLIETHSANLIKARSKDSHSLPTAVTSRHVPNLPYFTNSV